VRRCLRAFAIRRAQRGREGEDRARARPLVQRQGVACLVADDPQWAVRVNADGVHIDGEAERLQSALRALRPGHIVGAGGLPTRDAAMTAGEGGADYVMFGGGGEPHDVIVERVAWWAEIFNAPCVGYAHDLGAIGDLVRPGADFIALGDTVFDPRGTAGSGRMTDRSGNRNLWLCAGLAVAWAALQGSAVFAPARADPSARQPAEAGTPSNPPLETNRLPVPARLGGAPDIAFAAYQRGYYVTAMREAMKRIEADPSDGPAMTLIGELYSHGMGVRRDTAEAARWYKLAAERSDRQAIFALGMAKLKGEGVPHDRAGAAALFEQAAAQHHPGALYNLGVLAIENDGVTSDFPRAARLFRQSAELGYSDAAYALGLLYRNGSGVEKSDEQAAQWIGRAAKDDNVPAQVEYAIMLFNGIGVEKDETAAAKLFLKAAVRNNPVAQNRAARLLAAGRGLPKDTVEAMKWHLLARAAGEKDAWLDGELTKLSAQEKSALEASLHQYVGN
jgi:uncharacterized protein